MKSNSSADQSLYPVINISFASIKEPDYVATREKICEVLKSLYIKFSFLFKSDVLEDADSFVFTEEEVFAALDECGLRCRELKLTLLIKLKKLKWTCKEGCL